MESKRCMFVGLYRVCLIQKHNSRNEMSSATIDRVIQALHWRKAIAVELPAFHSATAHPPPIKNSLQLHSRYFRHYARSFALDVHFYSVLLCLCWASQIVILQLDQWRHWASSSDYTTPVVEHIDRRRVDALSSFSVTLYSFTAHFYLLAF